VGIVAFATSSTHSWWAASAVAAGESETFFMFSCTA
jgi:hypothetical protein